MKIRKTSLKTLINEHKPLFLVGFIVLLVVIIITVVTISSQDSDGVEGDSSKDYDASLVADQRALSTIEEFKISSFLPIVSADPSYQISYILDTNEEGNYTFHLTLSALSASGRPAMIKRLLTEDFDKYDPLDYDIEILNYYNPFTDYSLDDLKSGHLPPNIESGETYNFGDSPYSARTLIHTLYDGSKNIYRYILEDGEPKSMPQLLFTYADLPYLDHQTIRSINTLE